MLQLSYLDDVVMTHIDFSGNPRGLTLQIQSQLTAHSSAPHDAVLALLARYASVASFRKGDIRGDGSAFIMVTKAGGPSISR